LDIVASLKITSLQFAASCPRATFALRGTPRGAAQRALPLWAAPR